MIWPWGREGQAPSGLPILRVCSARLNKDQPSSPCCAASAFANHPSESVSTNCRAITRLNLKICARGSFCQDIPGSSQCTYTNQQCVGKGVSFKYRHDLNSQWRIKICRMRAAIRAVIKCAHLNVSQLCLRVSGLSNIPALSSSSYLYLKFLESLTECCENVSLDSFRCWVWALGPQDRTLQHRHWDVQQSLCPTGNVKWGKLTHRTKTVLLLYTKGKKISRFSSPMTNLQEKSTWYYITCSDLHVLWYADQILMFSAGVVHCH